MECQGHERFFELAQCFVCSLKCVIIPWLGVTHVISVRQVLGNGCFRHVL